MHVKSFIVYFTTISSFNSCVNLRDSLTSGPPVTGIQPDSQLKVADHESRFRDQQRHCQCVSSPSPDLFVLLPLSLLIKTSTCTEMLRWAFTQESLTPSSQVAGTWINLFSYHHHLSHKFGFCCSKPLKLGSVTLQHSQKE